MHRSASSCASSSRRSCSVHSSMARSCGQSRPSSSGSSRRSQTCSRATSEGSATRFLPPREIPTGSRIPGGPYRRIGAESSHFDPPPRDIGGPGKLRTNWTALHVKTHPHLIEARAPMYQRDRNPITHELKPYRDVLPKAITHQFVPKGNRSASSRRN